MSTRRGQGTGLRICDSQGRPRIVLEVGTDDSPHLRVQAEDGTTLREVL